MPWIYIRRAVAKSWGLPPWEVDEAPVDEVLTELRILELEGETRSKE